MDYIKKMLAANEEVLFRTRRHWFVLFGAMFREFLVLFALAVAGVLLTTMALPIAPWAWIVLGAVGIIVLITMLINAARWSNQEFLVTNRRVIHSSGIINKSILDSSLSKINDVILTQSWMGRMFGYGTIKILTASDEVINLLDRIRHPIELKRAMLDAKGALEGGPAVVMAPQTSATQLLEELAALKSKNLISEEEYQAKRKEILQRM